MNFYSLETLKPCMNDLTRSLFTSSSTKPGEANTIPIVVTKSTAPFTSVLAISTVPISRGICTD